VAFRVVVPTACGLRRLGLALDEYRCAHYHDYANDKKNENALPAFHPKTVDSLTRGRLFTVCFFSNAQLAPENKKIRKEKAKLEPTPAS
jgi:hypothetical protein